MERDDKNKRAARHDTAWSEEWGSHAEKPYERSEAGADFKEYGWRFNAPEEIS